MVSFFSLFFHFLLLSVQMSHYILSHNSWYCSWEACPPHLSLLLVKILGYLTPHHENFPAPRWGFEVIMAKSHSFQQFLPQLYGLCGGSFVIKIALTSSAISSCYVLLALSLLLAFSSGRTVLASHRPLRPVFVANHSSLTLWVRSGVIDCTQAHTHFLSMGVWLGRKVHSYRFRLLLSTSTHSLFEQKAIRTEIWGSSHPTNPVKWSIIMWAHYWLLTTN